MGDHSPFGGSCGQRIANDVSLAMYMGQKVVLKNVSKKGLLTSQDLHDLKTVCYNLLNPN